MIIYHLLNEQQSYRELGPGHAEEQLEQLGYQVSLQSIATFKGLSSSNLVGDGAFYSIPPIKGLDRTAISYYSYAYS